MPSTRNIINKAAVTTSEVTHGLLNPEQSGRFIRQTFEATPLSKMVRCEMRRAKKGEIDKMGIATRMLRKKIENTDDGGRVMPTFGSVAYETTAVRLPWELTEETLRENIEGEGLEASITELMTRQMGIDREDLCVNGDTDTKADDPDIDFLSVNDGWVKQMLAHAHVEDRTAKNGGAMSLDVFYDALLKLPKKYNNGTLHWMMSPLRKQMWERYILNKAVSAGGVVSDRRVENPAGIPIVEAPSMPDDKVILTNPQNLVVVSTYDVKIRKTTEGRDAIMQDKRFYVIHFDFDPIVEEMDAAVIIRGLV